MNELTRRAANALVATVDFFSGALAAESLAGEEKQKQLDALASQLAQMGQKEIEFAEHDERDRELEALRKRCVERDEDVAEIRRRLGGADSEPVFAVVDRAAAALREEHAAFLAQRERVEVAPILTIEEARKILVVLQHVRRLLTVFPRKPKKGPLVTFSGIIDDLERAMKDLDDIKLEP